MLTAVLLFSLVCFNSPLSVSFVVLIIHQVVCLIVLTSLLPRPESSFMMCQSLLRVAGISTRWTSVVSSPRLPLWAYGLSHYLVIRSLIFPSQPYVLVAGGNASTAEVEVFEVGSGKKTYDLPLSLSEPVVGVAAASAGGMAFFAGGIYIPTEGVRSILI